MADNKCGTCGYPVQAKSDGGNAACWKCSPLIDLVTGEKCLQCTWTGPYLLKPCSTHDRVAGK